MKNTIKYSKKGMMREINERKELGSRVNRGSTLYSIKKDLEEIH